MADRHRRATRGPRVLPWRTALLAALFGLVLLCLDPPSPAAPPVEDGERHGAADLRAYLSGASPVEAVSPAQDRTGAAARVQVLPTAVEAAPAGFKGAAGR